MKSPQRVLKSAANLICVVACLLAVPALTQTARAQAQERVNPPAAKNRQDVNMTSRELADKAAIKELVDRYSILADQKAAAKQGEMFTKSAVLETYRRTADKGEKGELISKIEGPANMVKAFEAFLKPFETVYHFNGQSVVELNGDNASGIAYCTVNLISNANGKRMMRNIGIHYYDEYVRENGKWLFAKRTTIFDWETQQELAP